jgi:drug/metabolite transporter (DMT)-like permease
MSFLLRCSNFIFNNAYVLLFICAACWGGNAVAARFAVGEVSPLLLTFLRWFGVSIIILILARGAIIDHLPILKARWVYLFFMGAVGFAGFNILFYISAHSTTAINIGILQGALPVFVLIGTFITFREPISLIQLVGILITILGVTIVATSGDIALLKSVSFNPGDLLMLVACLIYSGYTVFLRIRPDVPGIAMFAVISVAAMLASLPFAVFEWAIGNTIWPSSQGIFVILFVVIFPSFMSQLFFIRGVQLIGASRAGIFINLVPVFASVFSILVIREEFENYHTIGLLLVLMGIWVAERIGTVNKKKI